MRIFIQNGKKKLFSSKELELWLFYDHFIIEKCKFPVVKFPNTVFLKKYFFYIWIIIPNKIEK